MKRIPIIDAPPGATGTSQPRRRAVPAAQSTNGRPVLAPAYTLAGSVTVEGAGLHTGRPCRVVIQPRQEQGYEFRLGEQRIPARAELACDSLRCTALRSGGAQVQTVEHLLSALYGLDLDAAVISVEGPELPILDGSARPWVEALQQCGRRRMDSGRSLLVVNQGFSFSLGNAAYHALPAPHGALWVTFVSNANQTMLRLRTFSSPIEPALYAREIAPARTWVFREDLDELLAAGLGRGGSLDNALIIDGCETSSPLRLPEEPVRHKALDLLGDLALTGARVQGHIVAVGGGHRANVAFALALRAAFRPHDR